MEEKATVKDLSVYKRKFDEDIMSFREFEAMDFVRELKNQGNLDEAIEVGKTFLSVRPELKAYINHYGYALYNKYIRQDGNSEVENEKLYFSFVKDILDITKQEKYSPYETTVNHVIKYASTKDPVDYTIINEYLDLLDPTLLSKEPFIASNKKEGESRFERWYRLKVRALYELEDYKACLTFANQALAQPIKWHYRNLQWIKYYRAMSNQKLGNYEECERDFLSLQGQIHNVDFYRALFELYSVKEQYQDANAFLLYDLYISGYSTKQLSLYELLLQATKQVNDTQLEEIVSALIYKIKEETNQLKEEDTVPEKYQDNDSGELYDRVMDELTNNLDRYVERKTGKIVHYNQDKMLGSIRVDDDDPIFFRQADFIFDEELRRFDAVEYTVMKAYDFKKDVETTKAVLLLLSDDYDDYSHF